MFLFVVAALVLHCLLRDIWVALRPCKTQQPQEQRYPFLTVCAVSGAALPIPYSVCSIRSSATHSLQCVQYQEQRYPFLTVCAVSGAALPIPYSVCSIRSSATHSLQCVQYQEQRYPFLTVCAVSGAALPIPYNVCSIRSSATHSLQCVQCFRVSIQWYGCQCLGFFNTPSSQMLMYTIAQGGCTDTVRESALEIDCGRKILCRTGDPNPRQSVLRLAFQSDALPTELCLTPFNNVSVFLKIEGSRAV